MTTEITKAILPIIADTGTFHPLMEKYLSYRACGFSIREACKLSGVHQNTVRRWREANPEFNRLDTVAVGELVDKFSHTYLGIEFTRNFRLVLRKDFEILIRSIANPASLSSADNQYLLKLRSHYSPEQFAIVRKLAEVGSLSEFDFTKMVLSFSQEASAELYTVKRHEAR